MTAKLKASSKDVLRWTRKPAPKRSKYGNRKTEIDGLTFDSAKEAKRWGELKLLERAGRIRKLRRQVSYDLLVNGRKVGRWTGEGDERLPRNQPADSNVRTPLRADMDVSGGGGVDGTGDTDLLGAVAEVTDAARADYYALLKVAAKKLEGFAEEQLESERRLRAKVEGGGS